MAFGPKYQPHSRSLLDFFGRWRSPTRNIAGLWDGVIPVAVIDRFRDDDEGSLFAINASTPGLAGRFSAVAIGSADNDLEVLACRATASFGGPFGAQPNSVHLFTPINPFNPVSTPSPPGFFNPGLITNKQFTFGSVLGVAGHNPALPGILGLEWELPQVFNPGLGVYQPQGLDLVYFDPPIRVYRDTTLAIQSLVAPPGLGTLLIVSFLYRERPKSSQ